MHRDDLPAFMRARLGTLLLSLFFTEGLGLSGTADHSSCGVRQAPRQCPLSSSSKSDLLRLAIPASTNYRIVPTDIHAGPPNLMIMLKICMLHGRLLQAVQRYQGSMTEPAPASCVPPFEAFRCSNFGLRFPSKHMAGSLLQHLIGEPRGLAAPPQDPLATIKF